MSKAWKVIYHCSSKENDKLIVLNVDNIDELQKELEFGLYAKAGIEPDSDIIVVYLNTGESERMWWDKKNKELIFLL